MELSQSFVREFVDYCPESGVFTHRYRDRKWFSNDAAYALWNARWAGKENGTIQSKGNGYRRVKVSVNGKQYLAHRVAWVYMTGEGPPKEIDHIDGDGLNNKWANLRDGTDLNQKNKGLQRNNRSGICGVYWSRVSQKWATRIWVNKNGQRVYKHLGVFSSIEAAEAAVREARKRNGYSDRHGSAKPYPTVSR